MNENSLIVSLSRVVGRDFKYLNSLYTRKMSLLIHCLQTNCVLKNCYQVNEIHHSSLLATCPAHSHSCSFSWMHHAPPPPPSQLGAQGRPAEPCFSADLACSISLPAVPCLLTTCHIRLPPAGSLSRAEPVAVAMVVGER